jgi:type II secretory pathway pseudopilin PulG
MNETTPTLPTTPGPRQPYTRRGRPVLRRQAGFTLAELLVALGIMVGVLLGVLALFDLSSKVARVQTNVADMQQSLRISQAQMMQDVRMAGRGPLPLVQFPDPPYAGQLLPTGVAVSLRNNVAANTSLGVPACACARVVEGTDRLSIRGVFNSPIYLINPAAGAFQVNSPNDGTLLLSNFSPTGVPQDLQPIKEAILNAQGGDPEPMVLVGAVDAGLYAVVEISSASSFTPAVGTPESATINFTIQGGTHTDAYLGLSPGGVFPPGLATVAYAGLLEEYTYYVREEYSIPGDNTSELMPLLSRARVYPGTVAAYLGDTSNLHNDMADNVIDLQIALGIDSDGDDAIVEASPPTAADDWLFNSPADDPTDAAKWNNTPDDPRRLFYVRVSTLARTNRPDPRYQAPPLATLEDKDYSVAPFNAYNSREERMRRRRVLQTVIDLRNLS